MPCLPDLAPGEANEGHYEKFSDTFGTETTEMHLPSATLKEQKTTMDFIALKQHGLSTNLTIFRTECDKPQLVYAHKRPHNILREFKQITSDLLLTCDTTVSELTDNSKDSSQLPIRSNLTCLILVEKLYYSAGYDACCCHCGSKRKLVTNINAIHFPLCVNVKTRNK